MNTENLRPLPQPTEEPVPGEEQPAPSERPKRRRVAQPVFRAPLVRAGRPSRLVITGLAVCLSMGLYAQVQPTPSTNPTGQGTVTPQPVTPQRGWTMFDDNVGRELEMPPEQLQQLRAVDARYLNDYRALGEDPGKNPRYQELTDRRNADIRKTMNESMYSTWNTKYQPVPNTIQENRGSGISTPPPPTP